MLKLDGLRRFARDRSGGLAITAAMAAPVLVMLAGGAVDMNRLQAERLRAQDALDAAVLSGIAGGSSGDKVDAAEAFAANNRLEGATASFEIDSGEMTGTVNASVPTSFLTLIGVRSFAIRLSATAVRGDAPACVILLDKSQPSLKINSNSKIDATKCGVHVNSANQKAVEVNSNSQLLSRSLCVQGGVDKNSNSIVNSPAAQCGEIADPLSRLTEPSVPGSCHPKVEANSNQTRHLTPGCYTDIISNSNSTITLAPGVYHIKGMFQANSNSTISGAGVMLHLASKDAKIEAKSNSTLNLSAPTSGDYAGMVVFQSRDAAKSSPDALLMNSNVHGKLEGVVYVPNTNVVLNSNVSSTATYTLFVAKGLLINSNSQLTINYDFKTGPPLPSAMVTPVRLES